MGDSSPVFGASWGAVAVETWLVSIVALVSLGYTLRRARHRWMWWGLCVLSAAAGLVSIVWGYATSYCDRAVASAAALDLTSCVSGGSVRRALVVPLTTLIVASLALIAFAVKRHPRTRHAAALAALLAALVVALGTLGLIDTASTGQDPNPVSVLIATTTIPPGTTADDAVKNGQLALRSMSGQDVPANALGNATALTGRVAQGTIYPGEVVVAQMFGKP